MAMDLALAMLVWQLKQVAASGLFQESSPVANPQGTIEMVDCRANHLEADLRTCVKDKLDDAERSDSFSSSRRYQHEKGTITRTHFMFCVY